MCIIVVKKQNVKFPSKETMRNCFENNPDGAGFMYWNNNKVVISKGFDTFNKFYKELQVVRKKMGDDIPYVLHFRISTQAHGRMDCTHPFPLSDKMEDLRKLNTTCDFGIAHNGIISLTSYGYGYLTTQTITYSDTMKFITDYLTLIIKDNDYYKDENTRLLIERLCESKLAIMDNTGHIELIGNGWSVVDGLYFSNTSYQKKTLTYNSTKTSKSSSKSTAPSYYNDYDSWDYGYIYDDDEAWFEEFWNEKTKEYDFEEDYNCPLEYGICDEKYCLNCACRKTCATRKYYFGSKK